MLKINKYSFTMVVTIVITYPFFIEKFILIGSFEVLQLTCFDSFFFSSKKNYKQMAVFCCFVWILISNFIFYCRECRSFLRNIFLYHHNQNISLILSKMINGKTINTLFKDDWPVNVLIFFD